MAKQFKLSDLGLTPKPAGANKARPAPAVVDPLPTAEPEASATSSMLVPLQPVGRAEEAANVSRMVELPATGGALVPLQRRRESDVTKMFSMKNMEEILLDMGVKASHVQIALRRAEQTKESLAQIMRDFGFLSGEGVAQAVSRQTNFQYFAAEDVDLIRRADFAGLKVGATIARYVPVGRKTDGTLLIAVPDAEVVNQALNAFHGEPRTQIVVASEHTIQMVYRRYFANTEESFDQAVHKYVEASKISRREEEDDTTLGLIREIYFAMLRHACYAGASDLYLYRSEYVGIIRLKVNGVGYIFRTIDPALYTRLLTKMVQDNQVKAEDLRVRPKETVIEFDDQAASEHQDIATRFGFRLELTQSRGVTSAVIRILDKNSAATDMQKLPFDEETREALARITRTSNGFFLVTGPTGSGKTTSLYALLKSIDAVERSVQSIENPIEYKHGLWMQFELRKDATNEGVEYNEWLRALLRNAPDVILIGEVRDKGVANICMDAANTGHLVFATLHTNSAVSALARLKALEIDTTMLSSTLLGILAQRLVQTLCDECAVEDKSSETADLLSGASYLGDALRRPRKAHPNGCENCGFTGYRGRRMVYELLQITPEIRDLVEAGAVPSAIARKGLPAEKSMWACGVRLVAEGVTSLQELRRVANEVV
ncbi:Type II secretion system protein E [compost metagenome]